MNIYLKNTPLSRVKIFPFAVGIVRVLSLLLLLFPWSLSTQTSSFSLSLDLNSSEGDQAISSLDVLPNRTVPIQIFATDIASASDLSLRFEFDPSQATYEGFKRSHIVSGTSALTGNDVANIGITLSANSPGSGLIGTIRFRTTEAFSGTDIGLVRARLVRDGQTETVSMDLSATLRLAQLPSPDFDRSSTVGIPDFLLFIDVFGSKEGQDTYEAKYDLNGDGEIGIPDFLLFMDNFGKVVNRPPVFTLEPPVTLSLNENTAPGQAIGEPIVATDGDGDPLTYRLSGADADSFAIDESTGQIQAKGTYNFEQKDMYSVTVDVSDGEGGETRLAVAITITDIDEPPLQPAPPSVSAIASTSLTVVWEEPVNTGPEITDYDVQYRQADSDVFTDANYDGTERRVRLTGLFSTTSYAIQVRATNEEGVSEWSESSEWKTSELKVIPGGSGSGSDSGSRGSDVTTPPPVNDPTPPISRQQQQISGVNIPDPNLRTAIESSLEKTAGAPITEEEMSTLTTLQATGVSIGDLTGLEFATGLTDLVLYNNSIDDISSLSELTALERLQLDNNSVSDISSLSELTNLEWLELDNNSVSDISSLSELTALERLQLYNNSISDISSLSELTNLETLQLENNSVSAISSLSELTNLKRLFLSGNSISDISSLSNLTRLEKLTLDNNSISDISSLSGLTNLEWLHLYSNSISDISSLSSLTNLEWLFLSDNSISDISSLSSLTDLERLDLSGNSISDISSLSGLTNLEWLFLSGNSISDISSLSGLTYLEWLDLSGNSISDILSLVTNTGLGSGDSVDLRNNSLSDTSLNTHIPTLEEREVDVRYE